ncbi:amino acid transporter AVT6C isoform X2 [Coffea arabica]|uniref:Amino acid transporter AVT6C isoform X2 n=1 Tax=Coffea arabica TaxID=13443 RepID=A0A6P6W7Z7_COFAR
MMAPAVKDDAGARVPLLPDLDSPPEKGPSIPGAVFNVSTSIIGAGIMSIPATLKVLGVVPAFVMIVVIGVIVDISVEFLLRFTYNGESRTYAGLMYESFGRVGSVAVQICVMLTNLGCLIIYLIIIESLWLSSAVSVFLAVVFVGICSVMAIYALARGETRSIRVVPELDNGASFFNLFTAFPVIITAFTFHFNVHPIGVELGKPAAMISAVRISLVLCGALYFTIGIFGYLLFGDSVMDDILVNFDQGSGSTISSLLNDIVRLSYALHLMLVFPLVNFSLRANIDELLFPKRAVLATDNKRFVILTLVLLGFSYVATIAIPSIWYFFQFMGSTSAVCLAFIFPGVIALRDIHGISTRRDRIIAAAMVILAVVTSTIAISTNVYKLVGNKS